jgi:acyl-CoA synthetase (AMP-forming)/AMP-acid ligase II
MGGVKMDIQITLQEGYEKAFRTYKDQICMIQDSNQFTYSDVQKRVDQLISCFSQLELFKGERIGILSQNRKECLELDAAIAISGLVKVPLNYRLHPNEHMYMIKNSGAKVLFVEEGLEQDILSRVEELPTIEHIFIFGNDRKDYLSYERLLEEKGKQRDIQRPKVHPNDLYAIMYTSGTTGRPKGVMLTQANFITIALSLTLELSLDGDERIGHFAPLTHGNAFFVTAGLMRGNTHVIFRTFNPADFLSKVEHYRITTVFLVPTMLNLVIHEPTIETADFSTLRSILYAGSPIAVEKLKLAIDIFGIRLVQTFGQMEAAMAITVLGRQSHLKKNGKYTDKIASCGREAIFAEVQVMDEHGTPLKSGEIGEVCTRGPLTMLGYWNNEEATNETIRNGWLRTGDLGWMDEDGYLYLVDRKKDVMITGGMNVYPREVEEILNLHPAVKEVCAFGIPDAKWGEAICAHIVLKSDETPEVEEIIEHCKQHMASYKKPKLIKFVQELPKNNYGKIMRRQLRDEYWQDSRKVN